MIVYHYDKTTCEYVGQSTAFESPLEPGKFLVPAHSTPIAPSFADDKKTLWRNGWVLEDIPSPEPETPPTIPGAKAAKQREIANAADIFLSSMAQEYGAYEKLTWDQQSLESDALLSDPESPAPLVRAIASARGMTALEMAGRIAANRAQWVALSGAVVGKRLAYQDALDAAQTVEEVAAIVPVFP